MINVTRDQLDRALQRGVVKIKASGQLGHYYFQPVYYRVCPDCGAGVGYWSCECGSSRGL